MWRCNCIKSTQYGTAQQGQCFHWLGDHLRMGRLTAAKWTNSPLTFVLPSVFPDWLVLIFVVTVLFLRPRIIIISAALRSSMVQFLKHFCFSFVKIKKEKTQCRTFQNCGFGFCKTLTRWEPSLKIWILGVWDAGEEEQWESKLKQMPTSEQNKVLK